MADNNVVNTPDNTTEESSVDSKELTRLKAQLRAQAERAVIQRHQDEYHEEAEKLFAENGLEFSRRLSPKEKAEKELRELLAAHPELAEKFPQALPQPVEDGDTPAPEHGGDPNSPF